MYYAVSSEHRTERPPGAGKRVAYAREITLISEVLLISFDVPDAQVRNFSDNGMGTPRHCATQTITSTIFRPYLFTFIIATLLISVLTIRVLLTNMDPPPHSSTDGPASVPLDKKDIAIHPVTSQGQGEIQDDAETKLQEDVIDDAAKFLAGARAEQYPPLTPEREKRLRKKIDSWMIPLVRGCCRDHR